MSKKELIVGRFNEAGKFVTKSGAKTLRLLPEASDGHTDHFLSDEAKLGNYAVVRGIETKTLIKDAEIVNVLDTIPSQLLAALLKSKEAESDTQRAARVGDLSNRILKELPDILGFDPSEDEVKDEETEDIIPAKKHLVAVVIGHSEQDKGAQSPYADKTQEWDYNSVIASLIQDKAKTIEIVTVFRDGAGSANYNKLPGKINKLKPDFIVSLHCNSATRSAYGTEMIYCPGSTKGKKLGEYLQDEVCSLFERAGKGNRGVRTPYNGRGSSLLTRTKAPCVITEPFFLSNKEDMKMGLEKMEELAEAYVRGLESYAASLAPPVDVVETVGGKLSYQGLNKQQFLRENHKQLEKMRKSSNTWAKKTFGGEVVELTLADIYLISNGEMGLKGNGDVHIHFGHSAGEIGLYPLPKNLSYWLDTKKTRRHTPKWDQAHSLEKNVQAFFDYMVSLKNKNVKKAAGVDLYKGLFRATGIKGDDIKEAEMLAAVVHGYFYSGVYSDKKVPIKKIAAGIKQGTPISQIMKDTSYKYANSKILVNREKNMNDAKQWLA